MINIIANKIIQILSSWYYKNNVIRLTILVKNLLNFALKIEEARSVNYIPGNL